MERGVDAIGASCSGAPGVWGGDTGGRMGLCSEVVDWGALVVGNRLFSEVREGNRVGASCSGAPGAWRSDTGGNSGWVFIRRLCTGADGDMGAGEEVWVEALSLSQSKIRM